MDLKTPKSTLIVSGCVLLVACLFGAVAPAEDALSEDQAIALLQSNAGWQEKYTACTRLRQIGTAKSVPALASLLNDEKLSHMARYALDPMPYPEVDQALRKALATTSGLPKAGVIISIGARRDAKSVSLLVPALKDSNPDISRAAAGALGRIGTPEAAKALMKFRNAAPDTVRRALADGLLAAGELLVRDGKGKNAVPVYGALLAESWPMDTRMGAFRGLAYAQPKKTPERLIAALGGDEPVFRDMAAQIVSETSGADDTAAYTDALPKLPAAGQAALLGGLGGRKDAGARAAVVKATNSSDLSVQLAAIRALETVGGADDVPALAALLASDNADVVGAAKSTLAGMKGKNVDQAIAASGAVPAARAQLIGILSDRMADQAKSLAVASLRDGAMPVRVASLRALAKLGGKDEAPAVVAALNATSDSSERDEAAAALSTLCSASGDDVLPIVLGALNKASPETRVVLLRSLGRIGSPKALEPVVAALTDSNAAISDAAVQVLANWPAIDAAPHLLKLAKAKNATRRDQGLRGYVRLAQAEQSADKKVEMLATAMKLTKRPEDKWLVLAAWGTFPAKQSLDALLPCLKDAAVQNETATAIIAVAAELGKKPEDKADAGAALQAVLDKCKDQGIRERAQKTLAAIGK